MIILHAGLEDGRLLLWGETPPAALTKTATRGRKPKSPPPRPFPFDPGAQQLADAVADVLPDAAKSPSAAEQRILWLPSVQDRPVASSALVAEPPEPGAAAVLAPWRATVLPLEPGAGHRCAAGACADRETLAPGVVVGATLAFWARALRFAGALAAREQFLPDVQLMGQSWRARWRPVLAGDDARRCNQLTQAMPAACRAIGRDDANPPDQPAAGLLAAFLDTMVDALARSSAAAPVVLPARRGRKPAPTFASVHDQWLHALRAPDGVLTGSAAELGRLAEQVHDWQRPVTVAAEAPFRLCFRLEEPPSSPAPLPRGERGEAEEEGSGEWQVRYLLQAADDPSLLIPVAEAWAPKGRHAAVFRARGFDAREYLLTALGQAAGLCPPVEASLKSAAPSGFATDAAGAHRFLTETAWLAGAGGVRRPAAGVVDAQGDQAEADAAAARQGAQNAGRQRHVARRDRHLRLAGRAR